MTRVWMRSIIVIFVSFAFGFLIGTIPVQKNMFPAYSQWVTNQKESADALNLSQSSRHAPDEGVALPEPGTLEEQQLVDRFTMYPLHFLEKTIEAKRRLVEDTQVRSFFTLAKEDAAGKPLPIEEAKKWVDRVNASSYDTKVYKARVNVQAGPNHFPLGVFFAFRLVDGKYCWRVAGQYELVDRKERFSNESCENLNDLGRFQDAPYALFPVSERGVRDWISYLALPVPILQEQPAKMLSLESETGLWKEEMLIDWQTVDAAELARFDSTGVFL